MNATICDISFYDETASSLSQDEKLSVAAAVAVSLAFSGGLAWLAVQTLLHLQA